MANVCTLHEVPRREKGVLGCSPAMENAARHTPHEPECASRGMTAHVDDAGQNQLPQSPSKCPSRVRGKKIVVSGR